MKKEGAKIMKNMIETKNLTKTYKAFTAVDHVSLHIKNCLLYTSDAADEEDSVDLGGRHIN